MLMGGCRAGTQSQQLAHPENNTVLLPSDFTSDHFSFLRVLFFMFSLMFSPLFPYLNILCLFFPLLSLTSLIPLYLHSLPKYHSFSYPLHPAYFQLPDPISFSLWDAPSFLTAHLPGSDCPICRFFT